MQTDNCSQARRFHLPHPSQVVAVRYAAVVYIIAGVCHAATDRHARIIASPRAMLHCNALLMRVFSHVQLSLIEQIRVWMKLIYFYELN